MFTERPVSHINFRGNEMIRVCYLALIVSTLASAGCEVTNVTDARGKELQLSDILKDDVLADKHPVFDETLVDSRELDGWQLNASGAVIRLDTPMARSDWSPERAKLYPTCKAAKAATKSWNNTLVSVNMVDAKSKQFDDGLYAALDQAYFQGLNDRKQSLVSLVRRIYDGVPANSEAAAYLAAGLILVDEKVDSAPEGYKQYLQQFQSNEIANKPISFYTWNDTLQKCWRFMKYFQQPLEASSQSTAALKAVLDSDEDLRNEYLAVLDLYAHLTNPLRVGGIIESTSVKGAKGDQRMLTVALFPPSTSREAELFERIFAKGLLPDANLMREFVKRIKSGEVDLSPAKDSGWYDYQVHALETFLLPGRGAEKDKLLLTKEYKQRMLEAFEAILTSRREIHARQMGIVETSAQAPPKFVVPRLRVEPSPTFFLRTARAYSFLQRYLNESVGQETLEKLHALKESGPREQDLASELNAMKDLFYGLYLVSCEDIGMKPQFEDKENVDVASCYDRAKSWLTDAWNDEDVAIDRRVSIPIAHDVKRNVTRLWVVVGVRLTQLDASYATAPMIRDSSESNAQWKPVESHLLEPEDFLIAVDEFAEVELQGSVSLDRKELRAICDRYESKDQIVVALKEMR